MVIPFTKMHGLGNDFVVFDATKGAITLTPPQIRKLADRRFGVGCDQVLLVEPSTAPGIDFRYRIFNADGGEVEQCGNGARCFARYVYEHGLSRKTEIAVETNTGVIYPHLQANGEVSVNMGVPQFNPAMVPFTAAHEQLVYTLQVNGASLEMSVVSMGNPHAVVRVDDIDTAPVATLGPQIERHAHFPKRVNAGFMQVVDATHLRVRVYERGVGETLACGTGACAAMVSARRRALVAERVTVSLRGGDLAIAWAGMGAPVWMTGPAHTTFEGSIDLDRL